MATIHHKIQIQAPKTEVYAALSTLDGLRGWWTTTTTGVTEEGGVIDFRFGDHLTAMRVDSLEPSERVAWECIDSTADWVGTAVDFDLGERDDRTTVRFRHRDWAEAGDFFSHCSTKWATFLVSLKQFVETGTGRPFPDDQPI